MNLTQGPQPSMMIADVLADPEMTERIRLYARLQSLRPSPFFKHSDATWRDYRRAEQQLFILELKLWRKYKPPVKPYPLP